MSTRSIIATNNGGEYRAVYCHHDGYPSHVGALLLDNYTTQEKVNALIALGDISGLRATLEDTEKASYMYKGEPRDQCEVSRREGFYALLKLCEEAGADFVYVFQRGQWFYMPIDDRPHKLIPLTREECISI